MSQAENETGQPQGMFKDVKRLRSDGTASVEELRAFLGELKGRSPRRCWGSWPESGLVRGMVSATIATVALLFVFTIGPWAYGELAGEPEQVKTATRPAPAASAAAKGPPVDPATQAASAAASVGAPGFDATGHRTPPGPKPDLGAANQGPGNQRIQDR
ncbi:MAG: hypothetical protein CM1200mP2_02100 [Planctomycetaceae bacterium]|nr:MAG: hypothetical protein CM1200mP2_02100 [Planctomycetaceae bacterium]